MKEYTIQGTIVDEHGARDGHIRVLWDYTEEQAVDLYNTGKVWRMYGDKDGIEADGGDVKLVRGQVVRERSMEMVG